MPKQFYFKQFSLVTIQLSKQFGVKTVWFQTIQFSLSKQFRCQNSFISDNLV